MRRVRVLVFFTLWLSCLCLSPLLGACRSRVERVYVSAEQSGEVVVVDPHSAQVIARVPVGKRPRGLKLSHDASELYVALSGSPIAGPNVDASKLPPADRAADGVGVIDLKQTKLVRTLGAGQDPESFDLSHDGRALYIANEETAELSKLDLASGKITQRITVGKQPEGVSVRPDGDVVYVACEDDDVVVAVDTRTGAIVSRIPTGKRPRAIGFSADGKHAYVTNELDASVTVLDTGDQRVIATIPIAEADAPVQRPMGIARSLDGRRLYVSTGRGGAVAQLDANANKLERLIRPMGSRPWGIALSPDGKRLYTANGPSNDLTILDLATGERRQVAIGGSPWGVVSTLQ